MNSANMAGQTNLGFSSYLQINKFIGSGSIPQPHKALYIGGNFTEHLTNRQFNEI